MDSNGDNKITIEEFYDFLINNPGVEEFFDKIIYSLQQRLDDKLSQFQIFNVPISVIRTRRPSLCDVDFRHMYLSHK